MKALPGRIPVYRILLVAAVAISAFGGFAGLDPGGGTGLASNERKLAAHKQSVHVSHARNHLLGQAPQPTPGVPSPAGSPGVPSPAGSPGVPSPAGQWILSFDDEFSSPAELSNWSYAVGNAKSQKMLQWDDPANATVDNGNLVITADHGYNGHRCWYGPCSYSSVSMSTKGHFAQARGIFEARMKIPVEHGIWPAFWMMSGRPDKARWSAGEIDIFEINGRGPANMAGGFGHTDTQFVRVKCYLDSPLYNAYHIYGIQWTRTGITWMVDGKACKYMKAYHGWPFNWPFHMILTLAVGGNWPGPPDASTHFPVKMYVDWVRVYRHV